MTPTSDSLIEPAPQPRVGAVYRHGWQAFLDQPAVLFVMSLLAFGVGAFAWHLFDHSGVRGLAGLALVAFVATPIAMSLDYLCLRAARGEAIGGRDVTRFKRRYADVVVAGIGMNLLIFGGLVLLLVPGIVIYCRLRFVPYLVLDEGLVAGEALRASWELTRGYGWTVFWISLAGVGLFMLGVFVFLLGAAVGDLLARLATASLYHATVQGSDEIGALEDELLAPSV